MIKKLYVKKSLTNNNFLSPNALQYFCKHNQVIKFHVKK